ncbi:MAG: hypothetical protein SStaBPW_06340 [Shewanella algae]
MILQSSFMGRVMGKSKRNITNWKQYKQALVNHGLVTFWLDEAAINTWHCTQQDGGHQAPEVR